MIRFFGGRVMTLANGIETQDIEVWTEGSKIVFVGKPTAEELDGKVFEREYDLKGHLLMPSFKNAHTHSAMTFLRSYADDMLCRTGFLSRSFQWKQSLTERKFTGSRSLLYLNISQQAVRRHLICTLSLTIM